MIRLKRLWSKEPVAVCGAVSAALSLAAAFGLNLSPGQIGAVSAFLVALAAAGGRSQVASVSELNKLAES